VAIDIKVLPYTMVKVKDKDKVKPKLRLKPMVDILVKVIINL